MTRRLEDATASERRSRTGYIKRSEMCSDAPNPPVSRLEDDTSDVRQVATASRAVEGEPLYPRVPLRSAPPVIEIATSSRAWRLSIIASALKYSSIFADRIKARTSLVAERVVTDNQRTRITVMQTLQ